MLRLYLPLLLSLIELVDFVRHEEPEAGKGEQEGQPHQGHQRQQRDLRQQSVAMTQAKTFAASGYPLVKAVQMGRHDPHYRVQGPIDLEIKKKCSEINKGLPKRNTF